MKERKKEKEGKEHVGCNQDLQKQIKRNKRRCKSNFEGIGKLTIRKCELMCIFNF
jgi:hypothetical protein